MIKDVVVAILWGGIAVGSAPWWGGTERVGWRHRIALGAAIAAMDVAALMGDRHWLWTDAGLLGIWMVVADIDWREHIIPNRLVLLTVFWGLIMTPWTQAAFLSHVGMGLGLVGFYLLVHLFTRGGLGMGDVKFSGAQGFVLGWPQGVLASAMGVWAAGLYALILLLAFHRKRRHAIALGPFLAFGGLLGLLGIMH
ncbi:MAG: prepilin peptidase [Sulfobacillus thermosulfidooxidans]|uniref:Prepilin type IV endopeptidase peptidase domain-containing protein n=1 Tax=Sulfobacillus thermotolerans TaxID=338644 RepID=A0ABN5H1M0_9FIRM|nr:A24 family peptidase [Sulfobacillus sp. hq2]AUW93503.1 hypothetical protein BXT84_05720 [Sulfobacillus thermotolerans]MCY0908135.1 A24 family peptidase [Sulfobacillus thermotolerans]POB10745.1 hypothetical protein CO251_07970 [Sulfobacillus sp. hq2]PSR36012.1 MAG: prepilin peptidase [Sulfobacillus thermosulfidooxidans]